MPPPASPEIGAEVLFVEPHSGGRISGGYLYNQRIAAAASEIRRCPVGIDTLDQDLARLDTRHAALVLLDSLFLAPDQARAFARLKSRTGAQLGVMLHAFPSFIARGHQREQLAQSLPLYPTALELQLLEQLDLLVTPGPYAARLLAECGSPIARVICPPGVDPAPAPMPRRSREDVLQFLSLGSVTPLKGLLDALEALRAMATRAWHWTIVGSLDVDSQFVAELRRRIGVYQLDAHVQLAAERDHSGSLAALRASDVLLISSFTENHPLVALEALAAGVPVAGYAVGGLPDIIAQGETGWLAPLLDIPALSAICERLVGDPRERRRLGENAVRAGARLPRWEDAARHFVHSVRAARSCA